MSYTKKGEDELHVAFPQEDIECKTCENKNDGTIYSNDYTKASCQEFPYPQVKPLEVLFKGAHCPKYRREK